MPDRAVGYSDANLQHRLSFTPVPYLQQYTWRFAQTALARASQWQAEKLL